MCNVLSDSSKFHISLVHITVCLNIVRLSIFVNYMEYLDNYMDLVSHLSNKLYFFVFGYPQFMQISVFVCMRTYLWVLIYVPLHEFRSEGVCVCMSKYMSRILKFSFNWKAFILKKRRHSFPQVIDLKKDTRESVKLLIFK